MEWVSLCGELHLSHSTSSALESVMQSTPPLHSGAVERQSFKPQIMILLLTI